MAVSNYNTSGATYSYSLDKLAKVVYLVQERDFDIEIDNGRAYVQEVTEEPIVVKALTVNLTDTSELSERYSFSHQVTFSVQGYANHKDLEGYYYVIVRSEDGTFYLVNPYFPCKVSYTYTLGTNESHTDFTMQTESNYPVLMLENFDGYSIVGENTLACAYASTYIHNLKLNESKYTAVDNGIVYYTNDGFKDVNYNKNTLKYTEAFDGDNVTHTLEFNIGLEAYKTSWHYNLLEFQDNEYAAIIQLSDGNAVVTGYGFGLIPSFQVTASNDIASSNIAITLTDSHNTTDLTQEYSAITYNKLSATTWEYTKDYGYECVSAGNAKYTLQEERDALGNPTGRYKALQGHTSDFPDLNIIGTFNTDVVFPNSRCAIEGGGCGVSTSLPSTIHFNNKSCKTFSLSAHTNWSLSSSNSNITVSPSTGTAEQLYSVMVCNNLTPTSTAQNATLTLSYCDTTAQYNVVVQLGDDCIYNTTYTINGTGQYIQIPTKCCVQDVVDPSGTIVHPSITNSYIKVYVPKNTTSARTLTLNVTFCDSSTTTITIVQAAAYESWISEGTVCEGTSKCTLMRKYTGTTASNLTPTDETRLSDCSYSTDCVGRQTRWVQTDPIEYTCSGGKKYALEKEQASTDGGAHWTDTGNKRLGAQVADPNNECGSSSGGTGFIDGDLTVTGRISGGTSVVSPLISGSTVYGDIVSGQDATFDTVTTNQLSAVTAIIQDILADNITVDYLTVTKAAHFFSLIIDEIKSVGGQVIITPANAEIDKVVERSSAWRCYFRANDGDREIHNQFATYDQVVCQTFNVATGTSYNISNHYYWRLCTGIGTEDIELNGESGVTCHYIDLSKTDYDQGSYAPRVGDKCVQLGNRNDSTRQNAIILSAYNTQWMDKNIKAPSIVQYSGIDDYNLSNHRVTIISDGLNRFKGDFITTDNKNIVNEINSVSGNVYSLTQLYSSINQTVSGINQTVSSQTVQLQAISGQVQDIGQVGGVNLLHNSAFDNIQTNGLPKKWGKWCNSNSCPPTLYFESDGIVTWCHTYTNTYWQGIKQYPDDRWTTNDVNEGFKPNQKYTFSVDAYGTGQIGCIVHFRNASNVNVSQTGFSFDLSASPQRFSYTFTTPNDSSIIKFGMMIGTRDQAGVGSSIVFSHPKLEIGSTATDWSPSPYDDKDALIVLNQKVGDLQVESDNITATVSATTQNISTLSGTVTSQQSDIGQLKVQSSAVTSQVTAIRSDVNGLYNDDTQNLFKDTSYAGGELSMGNKWEFDPEGKAYSFPNLRNYGTPIYNGIWYWDNNANGWYYLYAPYVYLSSGQTYTLATQLEVIDASYTSIIAVKYANAASALARSGSTASSINISSLNGDVDIQYDKANNEYDRVFTFTPLQSGYYRIRIGIMLNGGYDPDNPPQCAGGYLKLYKGNIAANKFERWNTTQASNSSLIQQTAYDITLAVDDVNLKIDNKGVEINADTVVNGTLTLNNSDQGFVLNGTGGNTSITPQSIGSYTSFQNKSDVTNRYSKPITMPYSVGNSVTYSGSHNLGFIQSGKIVTLKNFQTLFRKENSGNNITPTAMTTTFRIYNGGTQIASATTSSYNYSGTLTSVTLSNAGTIRIDYVSTVSFATSVPSGNMEGQYNFTGSYPSDAFTMIGSDGIGLNFGNNRTVYFGAEGAYLNYGNYGIRVDTTGLYKKQNGSWVSL